MQNVEIFDKADKVIKAISHDYNLVIISSTDEIIIRDYLSQPKFAVDNQPLYDCFKYVFGKREGDFNWKNVDRKSQLIHKITSIVGVPVERMVYVGDNNGDFLASRKINIDFIEARLFSQELEASIGSNSLVFDQKGYIGNESESMHFTSWSDLHHDLDQVEINKRSRRKQQYGC